MCGFVGIINTQKSLHITDMLNSIQHRGPDQLRIVNHSWYSFGFCRLAINHLETGQQPIFDKKNNIMLSFNGEIYNHQELIKSEDLDPLTTEVSLLLSLYEKYGLNFTRYIEGDFAICIFDNIKKSVFLIRDPFGVKPLYFSKIKNSNVYIFSSHIAAFFKHPDFETSIDRIALNEKKIFGFFSSDRTIFDSIKQVKPGHFVTLSNFGVYSSKSVLKDNQFSNNQSNVELINSLIDDSLQKRLDMTMAKPVVTTMSGGIDSTILLKKIYDSDPSKLFLLNLYDNENSLDFLFSRELKKSYGLNAIQKSINFFEVLNDLPKIIYALGGYGPSYAAFYLSKYAKLFFPTTKVLICGEGADEFFLGYGPHLNSDIYWNDKNRMILKLPMSVIEASSLLSKFLLKSDKVELQQNVVDETLRAEQLLNMHLVPFDHSCMFFGIECRVPYVDLKLFNILKRMPRKNLISHNSTKIILKEILKKQFSSNVDFANSLINRVKYPAYYTFNNVSRGLDNLLSQESLNLEKLSSISHFCKNKNELFWLASQIYIFPYSKANIENINGQLLLNSIFQSDFISYLNNFVS